MKLIASLASAFLLSAVITPPAVAQEPAFDARPETFTLPELMGLDEAQLREKLGVMPAAYAYLSSVEERGGVQTRILRLKDLIFPGDTCGEGAMIGVVLSHDKLSYSPQFILENGRLTGLKTHIGEAAPGGAVLKRYCQRIATMSDADQALTLAIYSPFFAVGAAMAAPKVLPRAAARRALEDLRLGAEPPGGLGAYTARPPSQVHVGSPVNGRLVLTVTFAKAEKFRPAALVRVTVQEGRVVAIEKDRINPSTCALTPQGFLQCDLPTVRKSQYFPLT